jgi:hypothetical protein
MSGVDVTRTDARVLNNLRPPTECTLPPSRYGARAAYEVGAVYQVKKKRQEKFQERSG